MKRVYSSLLKKHPLGALYGTLLGIIAFFAAVPMWQSRAYDAAAVDLAMAGLLLFIMLKRFTSTFRRTSTLPEKITAWIMLIFALKTRKILTM